MDETNFPNPIAIDGPAASGKSTIGRMLADRLGYLFLDTGCMYRAVTLAALRQDIDPNIEELVVQIAVQSEMDIVSVDGKSDGRLYTVLLNGNDVTWEIRSNEVDAHVSQISSYLGVRENLVMRQRELSSRGCVVVVGRDIGTVVLPEAPLKLYIVASAEERARRRWLEQKDRTAGMDFQEILTDIIRRDKFDSSRIHSPLRAADDAMLIDTTGLNPAQVIDQILALAPFQNHQNSN
jgi:cytidylate kinase